MAFFPIPIAIGGEVGVRVSMPEKRGERTVERTLADGTVERVTLPMTRGEEWEEERKRKREETQRAEEARKAAYAADIDRILAYNSPEAQAERAARMAEIRAEIAGLPDATDDENEARRVLADGLAELRKKYEEPANG